MTPAGVGAPFSSRRRRANVVGRHRLPPTVGRHRERPADGWFTRLLAGIRGCRWPDYDAVFLMVVTLLGCLALIGAALQQ